MTGQEKQRREEHSNLMKEKSIELQKIVSAGIIFAIERAIKENDTVDQTVAEIGLLVEAYNEFFHTGR